MKLLNCQHKHQCCLLFISTCSLGSLFYWIFAIQIVENAFIARQQPNIERHISHHRTSEYESRKQIDQRYNRPSEKQNINCTKLVAGDQLTINNSYVFMKQFNSSTRNIKEDIFATNCSHFRRSRGFIDHALSDLEFNFPLAFGMAVYKDIELSKQRAVEVNKLKPPPHNITLLKGAIHVAVNREFVDFCINDQRAKDLLVWLNGTGNPDETFFASINHNPSLNISGSFLGDAENYTLKTFFVRYKNWMNRPCTGRSTRGICIVGAGDVHRAYADVGLFVNKFHLDYQYLGYDCLEEVLQEKTWQQYLDNADIDVQYYTHLDDVKYKL